MMSRSAPTMIASFLSIPNFASLGSPTALSTSFDWLDDLVRTHLQGMRTLEFMALIGATFLVIAGVVLEEVALIAKVLHLKTGQHLEVARFGVIVVPQLHPPKWMERIAHFGWIILVIGLTLEVFLEVDISKIDAKVESLSESQIETARGEAAKANEGAGEANERASKNEKEAAQLRRDAVELEDSISWRKLTPTSRTKLQSELDFAHLILGLSVPRTWLLYNNNDTEAFTFAMDLGAVLQSAKWNPTDPEPIEKMFEGPVPFGTNKLPRGVVVSTVGGKVEDAAASVLVKAISDLGFYCTKSPLPAIHEQHPNPTVFVFIDARPEGPQGEAKLRREAERKAQVSSTH